eukprot:SM000049S16705  [mRNA]  locus=s49:215526:216090:+ [translate_table: standard]
MLASPLPQPMHAQYGDGANLVVRGLCLHGVGMLAVVLLRLVEILERENRKRIPISYCLTLEEVHGSVCTSRDTDLLITASDPACIKQQIGAATKANLDVLYATGGYWTNDSDSDNHPLTEEDLAEIAAMERRHKEKLFLAKCAVETMAHPSTGYHWCQSLGVLAGGFMDEAKQRVSPFTR